MISGTNGDYMDTIFEMPAYIEVVPRPASDGGYSFKCYYLAEYC